MRKRNATAAAIPLIAWLVVSCNRPHTFDDSALRGADQDTANWLLYGRTYDDHRFSPLNQINDETVGGLGWPGATNSAPHAGWKASPW